MFKEIGNANANRFWLGRLSTGSSLRPGDSLDKRKSFIHKKYKEKLYCDVHPKANNQRLLNEVCIYLVFSVLLAPLAEGQRAIVMALCPLCVHSSVCAFIRPCMHVWVRKLFLQKTSPQKLLTLFLRNFTGMFLRWSSFEFLQIIVFYEEFWLPWRSK